MNSKLNKVKVLDLEEREKRNFLRDDLITKEGRLRLLSSTQRLSAVELRHIYAGIEVRVLGLIGYLPLTDELALNLHPKFPLKNLWSMLALSNEEYNQLLPILRRYSNFQKNPPHLLLVRSFCYFLKEIIRKGVAKKYIHKDFEGYFRPKVNFSKTITRFHSKGDIINVVGTEFVLSSNHSTNAFLKSACIAFLRLTPHSSSWKGERMLLLDALNTFEHISPIPMTSQYIWSIQNVPSWNQKSYRGALNAYAAYLGFNNMGFAYEDGGMHMPSFLFKLDDIFEQFIRNSLRDEFQKSNINVLDGNKPGNHKPLFQGNNQFSIKPDAIIKKGSSILAIGEMKYKPKLKEADRYQVISHVVASNAPLGLWIFPTIDENSSGLSYIGSIPNGARFYQYRLNLSGCLDEARKQMNKELAFLIENNSTFNN